MFADNFTDPLEYADTVVNVFQQKHRAVCELMKQEGPIAWPDAPPSVFDASQDPVQRLRELMVYARSLLPAREGHRLVWSFFPLGIVSPPAYPRPTGQLVRCH